MQIEEKKSKFKGMKWAKSVQKTFQIDISMQSSKIHMDLKNIFVN